MMLKNPEEIKWKDMREIQRVFDAVTEESRIRHAQGKSCADMLFLCSIAVMQMVKYHNLSLDLVEAQLRAWNTRVFVCLKPFGEEMQKIYDCVSFEKGVFSESKNSADRYLNVFIGERHWFEARELIPFNLTYDTNVEMLRKEKVGVLVMK